MLVSQTSSQMTVACVFIFVRSCTILHKVEMCSFELPQLFLTDMRLGLILTILLCTATVFYLHWLCIVINELIMQHTPGTWLFTYIQEVASLMERAITHADDPNIKVPLSSTPKGWDSSVAYIFRLDVWLGGRIEQRISAAAVFAPFISPENGGKASLNIAAYHTITWVPVLTAITSPRQIISLTNDSWAHRPCCGWAV